MNNGVGCTSKKILQKLSITILKKIYSGKEKFQVEFIKNQILSLNIRKLDSNQKEWLKQPFTIEEIKNATFQIGPFKAPKVDGKPGILY